MNDTPTKRCNKCHQEFPATLEYFYKWNYSRDKLSGQCKTCARERARQWREKNLGRAKETARRYRDNNRETVAERQRRYNESHKEQAAERIRRYNEAHPGRARERARQWYAEHREYVIKRERQHYNANRDKIIERRRLYEEAHRQEAASRTRQWVKDNPFKARENRIRRRARKHNAPGTHTAADIQQQYESQKGLCWWCGCKLDEKFHVDHRVPLSRGGSNAPENLVISCAKCNLSKHNKLPGEWNGRLL